MAEYIEREGLMHELGPYEENNFSQEMSVILKIVAGRPAADVAPVVHGRWKYHKYVEKYECTECGHFVKPGTDRNYCPNCGTKMDMEETDGLDTP